MGFDCSQTSGGDRGSGDVEAKLNLILYLERGETNPLLEGNTLTENAYVELMKQGQTKKLWPIDFENEYKFMKVEWERSAKRLKVSIGGRESVRTGGNMEMATEKVEQKFICKTEELRGGERGDKEIYRGELTEGNLFGWIPRDIKPLKISIKLAKCSMETDKKTAECDLKLTSGTDPKN